MENLSTDPGSIWNGEHENTKTHIQLKKPDVSAVLSQCSVASTRREDFLRSLAVFPENIEIFHETVVLRDEAARLLGFSSFAAQKLRHQIVKSPGDIGKLLDKLSVHLQLLVRGRLGLYSSYGVREGYLKDNGQRATVITALVCNASSPSKDRPALIQHRELITIFPELGHGMHDLLGKSMYAIFHGHRTVPDFVEAPSQLLEYWCWVPECPQKLSCHYTHLSPEYRKQWAQTNNATTQPPETIPETFIQSLIVLTLRQVAFSKVDMRIHNPDSQRAIRNTSIGEVYIPLLQDMTSLRGPEGGLDWRNGYVTTSHYMWDQEANYYSYLFTRILAADIWFSSFRTNPTSQEAGLRYRRMVLENGGGRDEWEVLIGVLGREPRPRMYSRDLGDQWTLDGFNRYY
ncbi:hypothetical protein ETB97_004787 [Aspergillus alliaceus]|uniref:Peptidase M3A/M3B catalytic domain-containing protein n=1 Tax=Petromyces alliaceus TaxID=209559 RepID=A0A8H6AB88_PETAA|nr:hypothetical protein ETB97_004787 [Aspergillus burnettii]